jgi:hypothetical protein
VTSTAFLGKEYMAERGKFAGPSILELMEQELDKATREDAAGKYQSLFSDGRIMGLASAIAIMRQPYSYLDRPPAPPFEQVVADLIAASQSRVAAAAVYSK